MVSGFITHNNSILLNGSNKLLVTGGALCKMDDRWQVVAGSPWISNVCC